MNARGGLGIALVALSLVGVWSRDLWPADELREAEIAREISGDPFVPRLNGAPFLEKPPLHYWAVGACFELLGRSDAVARFPSVLASMLTLALVWAWGNRVSGAPSGAWAAGLLACMSLFIRRGHDDLLDATLSLWITVALFAYHQASDKRGLLLWAFPAGLAAAFWTKGIVGPLLVGTAVLADRVTGRPRVPLRELRLWAGLAIGGLLCAPWPLALYRHGGEAFLHVAFVENTVGRALSGSSHPEHAAAPWWYLIAIWDATAPVCLLFPWMLWRYLRGRAANAPEAGAFALWGAAQIGFLSIPSAKRMLYLLPVLPVISLAMAAWLARNIPPPRRSAWTRTLAATAALWALGLSVWYPLQNPRRSVRGFCEELRTPGVPVLGYRWSEFTNGAVPYYLDRIVPVAPDFDALCARLSKARPGILITEGEGAAEIERRADGLPVRLVPHRRTRANRIDLVAYRILPRYPNAR